jgi:pantetheine-phosphate adenylyltransferase
MIGSGLTVEYAASIGASAIIRGIRAVSDYEYELMQATANMYLNDSVETLLLIARPQYSFLSSSVVKEIGLNHGDISELVPEPILDRVAKQLGSRE